MNQGESETKRYRDTSRIQVVEKVRDAKTATRPDREGGREGEREREGERTGGRERRGERVTERQRARETSISAPVVHCAHERRMPRAVVQG
jgi:hypothetical protein